VNVASTNQTAVGYHVGMNVTSGGNNALFGYQSGLTLVTGTLNTLVGYNSDTIAAATNSIVLGASVSADASNIAVIGNSSLTLIRNDGDFTCDLGSGSKRFRDIYQRKSLISGTTSGTITMQSTTGTWTLTLPTSGGSAGQYLSTDGSGTASWTYVSRAAINTQSSTYTVALTDSFVNYTGAGGGSPDITLPSAASSTGYKIIIVNDGAGLAGLAVTGGGAIYKDGSNLVLTGLVTNGSIMVISNGINWYCI
jgi:hypothetical protein